MIRCQQNHPLVCYATLPNEIYNSLTQEQRDKMKEHNLKVAVNEPWQVQTYDFNPLEEADQNASPQEDKQVEEDSTPLLDLLTGQDDHE